MHAVQSLLVSTECDVLPKYASLAVVRKGLVISEMRKLRAAYREHVICIRFSLSAGYAPRNSNNLLFNDQ